MRAHFTKKKLIVCKIGLLLSIMIIATAFLGLKAYILSWKELNLGNSAHEKGAYRTAILHYERAIKYYTPWNNAVGLAIEHLWQIGTIAEEQRDIEIALAAYRALRGSLYAVQSLYIPYSDWIPKSETKIAELMALTDIDETSTQNSKKYSAVHFKELLQRKRGVHTGWAIVVEVGFIGWIGSVIGLIWCVRDKDGLWSWRQGVMWGSGIFVFFTTWLIGMLFA